MAKKNLEENKKVEEVKNEEVINEYEELTLEERIINIEKKVKVSNWLNWLTTILLVFLLIMLLGSGNITSDNTDTGAGDDTGYEETASYDTSGFKTITAADIAKESKGKRIVVWIGRQSCGYCGMYAPYIKQAADNYGITAYYIDLGAIINFNASQPYITDSAAFDILNSLSGSGKWATFAKDNMGGTPLTLIIKDGKVIGGLSGASQNVESIEQVFSDAGIKKK